MTTPSAVVAPPVMARSGRSNWAWWSSLIGLCAVLLAPLLVVDVPPLLDYPNHLARTFVLASLPEDPVLALFYAPHWSIIPNLALDLVAPPLIHMLPVHVVGRLLIAAAVLLPVLGSVAYNIALSPLPSGRWWSLGAGLLAYNGCLLYGFLNFLIAIGLALLVAAAWLRWREDRPPRAITLAIIGVLVLFACHLMGLVFFGLLIGAAELVTLWQRRNGRWLRILLSRGLVLLLVFAAPAVLYSISALQRLGGDAEFLPIGEKLLQLWTPFINYCPPLDQAAAVVSLGLPTVCLMLRRGKVPGPAACAMALLLIAFLAAPYSWKGTYALDTRFAVMLSFVMFAGFIPVNWPRRLQRFAIALLILQFVTRMAVLTTAWAGHRADLADLRAVLARVQPGQAVYVAEAGLKEAPAYWDANPHWRLLANNVRTDEHIGALALVEHRAYWPFEFDVPSQQPIETRAPYRSLAGQVGHMPTWAEAAVADVCGFDYVLLLEADAIPDLPADRFRLLVRSGFAALYSVTNCKGKS
jgi:hypothetical protein